MLVFCICRKKVCIKIFIIWRCISIQNFVVPRWRWNFASTSEVLTSAIFEWLKLRGCKLWRRGYVQWQDIPAELHKDLPICSKVYRGNRQDGDLKILHFPFRKDSMLKTALKTRMHLAWSTIIIHLGGELRVVFSLLKWLHVKVL
jgi:hypothetical protein